MNKNRAPAYVVRALREALSAARMETAGFGFSHETVTRNAGTDYASAPVSMDEFIKEETRLYRHSYVVRPIEKALEWAAGT